MQTDISITDILRKLFLAAVAPPYKNKEFHVPTPPRYSVVMDDKANTRTRIREIREEKGIRQVELAEMIGVTQSLLSQMENGKSEINTRRMEQIARALDVSIASIYFGDDDLLHDIELLQQPDRDLLRGIVRQMLLASRTQNT